MTTRRTLLGNANSRRCAASTAMAPPEECPVNVMRLPERISGANLASISSYILSVALVFLLSAGKEIVVWLF